MSEPIVDFMKVVDALVQSGDPIELGVIAKLAGEIGKAFSVRPDEVAILATTPDEKFLRFLVPEQLRNVGTIPVNSTSALVSRTARERRAEIINNFTIARHSTVFEAVPLDSKQRGDPIQKIMSVPVMTDNKVAGVLQVSRKGKSVTTAGADFSQAELNTLGQYANHIGRCLALVKSA
ncbi:MAG TPA: GAF domain-containing protein [Candidatus Acidoferrales bacterium]|nr:GAF domain-containing protein [Candidatus Acidoferrales bacterium]